MLLVMVTIIIIVVLMVPKHKRQKDNEETKVTSRTMAATATIGMTNHVADHQCCGC